MNNQMAIHGVGMCSRLKGDTGETRETTKETRRIHSTANRRLREPEHGTDNNCVGDHDAKQQPIF